MEGDVHTAALLLLTVAPVMLARWLRDASADKSGLVKRAARALLGAVLLAAVCLSASVHACGAGMAFTQWLLPLAAWIAVELMRMSAWRRLCLYIGTSLAALALCLHYTALVHRPEYTGSPSWVERIGSSASCKAAAQRVWHTPFTGLYEVTCK